MRNLTTLLLLLVGTVFTSNNAFAAPSGAKTVTIVLVVADDDDDDDQVVFSTMYASMMKAEKIANILQVELAVSKDKIADDVFVFALKSSDQKDLAIKLIDEEGTEVGENLFSVEQGANYRTVNVSSLNDGVYTFRLIDRNGAEISEEFTVERGKRVEK